MAYLRQHETATPPTTMREGLVGRPWAAIRTSAALSLAHSFCNPKMTCRRRSLAPKEPLGKNTTGGSPSVEVDRFDFGHGPKSTQADRVTTPTARMLNHQRYADLDTGCQSKPTGFSA